MIDLVVFDLDGTLVEDHLIDEDERCPNCGSQNIVAQTMNDERPPWGCLHCGAEFEEPLPRRMKPRTDRHYTDPVPLPGVGDRVRDLLAYGANFAVATNQGGVALGYQTHGEVKLRIAHALQFVDFFYGRPFTVHYSLDHPSATVEGYLDPSPEKLRRRKPEPGMLEEAIAAAGTGPGETVFIGDRESDRECAKAAGTLFCDAQEWLAQGNTAFRTPALQSYR